MVRLKKLAVLATIVIILIGVILLKMGSLDGAVTANSEAIANNRILLDIGHGGVDGGAMSISGVKEADINLDIALRLRDVLIRRGYEVILTRDSDAALGKDKNSDMRARREIIENSGQILTVSIHQNYFSDVSCMGPQVFYAKNSEQGKLLAETIQREINEVADVDKPRQAMTGDYYIVKSGNVPAVIVECGFISNAEEEDRLLSPWYQIKLSKAIARGIDNYLKNDGGNDGEYAGAYTEK